MQHKGACSGGRGLLCCLGFQHRGLLCCPRFQHNAHHFFCTRLRQSAVTSIKFAFCIPLRLQISKSPQLIMVRTTKQFQSRKWLSRLCIFIDLLRLEIMALTMYLKEDQVFNQHLNEGDNRNNSSRLAFLKCWKAESNAPGHFSFLPLVKLLLL